MEPFLPEELVVIDRNARSPLAREAIRFATPYYPGARVADVVIMGDVASLKGPAPREAYAIITYTPMGRPNMMVGRCTVKMEQDDLTAPFEAVDMEADDLIGAMTTEDAERVARGIFSTPAMTGRPVDLGFIERLQDFLLQEFGDIFEAPVSVDPFEMPEKADFDDVLIIDDEE